jgi:hypothetical protein
VLDIHERREMELQREHDLRHYSEMIQAWAGVIPTQVPLLPPARARCFNCGASALLVTTPDGRRVFLDAAKHGDWTIKDELAQRAEDGDYVLHHTLCGTGR